ncbi:RNA dependent RNA polymerase-domain-containing protein [Neohortaea acidophila]|uniref:RNA-dependent RNA polymerase n=1 Tax=Neohortaea acidophila TaxID=245834 RepID=A0A6A6Q0J7_9PEZI|nr:RNA dependent RNA polymerase-domain-containing protein [Neohortaea acidophila]KAF2485998.1 RNA dependent RNA polymerase-domain-containing protein [Neohortaea acidophila]
MQMTNRPQVGGQNSGGELKLHVRNLPPEWGTKEIFESLRHFGYLIRIEVFEDDAQRARSRNARVVFSPPPPSMDWIHKGLDFANAVGNKRHVEFAVCPPAQPRRFQSPMNALRSFPENLKVTASQLDFGVMKTEDSMLVLHSMQEGLVTPIEMALNLSRKVVDLNFALPGLAESEGRRQRGKSWSFKIRINIAQMQRIVEMKNELTGQRAWVISIAQPPMIYRKTDNVRDTHEPGATTWTEWQAWLRQTGVETSEASTTDMIQLQKTSGIDFGRWLTYSAIFDKPTADSAALFQLQQALQDHNIPISKEAVVSFDHKTPDLLWTWLDNPVTVLAGAETASTASEMALMATETIHLPFRIRYQLEVCISQGMLHECNIHKDFLTKLGSMDVERAVKLLEKVADEGERFYDTNTIFARLMNKVSVVRKEPPWYYAMVRAAIITPTTISFTTPVLETSNRVIRKYHQHQDRFIRVKFTDEKYKGRVQSFGDAVMNEVFTRIKRTMTNGINVAGRHYEFLAFGNSQFREHGAWFFASTSDLTAQKIRDELGDFEKIKVVAKYCSRIGQCFSTTRATRWTVDDERIPDIERNGFCFSDGVGKISPFLARMIAQELGYPSSSEAFPSAFQFRREGHKGILVVDPSLKKHTIQTRPTQEKFFGARHHGLEIVRVSQFSTAYLNVQLILVLSALGVENKVFVGMMRTMLSDLEEAMLSERKAVDLLQKNIDYNHMTVQLAEMIASGFMETKDPFTISCLHLWRSWSLKYLKEKSRVFVEQGAFVLGCVDETATLRGHFEKQSGSEQDDRSLEKLPQIFLQIDPTCKGKWKVIEGVCILARNPSLHPGDIRVVMAVDAPALHHIKDCVVLSQTGDRDLANMCSGGDLDGDDYLVIWDPALLPTEWNHAPMDYTPSPPLMSKDKVTVDDMTSLFVTHMKHDLLGPIAVAHKYHADALEAGIKDPICLELAQLHSMAVDYAKSGVPAQMPRRLKVKRWPHWCEPKNKSREKVYHSKKIIGQLYDEVERVPFRAAWHLPFDQRMLCAYTLDDAVLQSAREVKEAYDASIRRIMSKYGIGTEFEVWSTFVLEHSEDFGDYKFAETIGEARAALVDTYRKLCYEKAGTDDREKMAPFVAAMYTVTAEEVGAAWKAARQTVLKGGRWVPVREPGFGNMPFMSFPWLFAKELGEIANGQKNLKMEGSGAFTAPPSRMLQAAKKKVFEKVLGEGVVLEELGEMVLPLSSRRPVEMKTGFEKAEVEDNGDVSDGLAISTIKEEEFGLAALSEIASEAPVGQQASSLAPCTTPPPSVAHRSAKMDLNGTHPPFASPDMKSVQPALPRKALPVANPETARQEMQPSQSPPIPAAETNASVNEKEEGNSDADDELEDEYEGEIFITIDTKPSALDALARMMEF